MSCTICGGFGVGRIDYQDGSTANYAVCRCAAGRDMRCETNGGRRTGYALWQVWAYRNQIDPARVGMIEEFLTDAELAQLFGADEQPTVAPAASAIAAAMRTARGVRL